MIRLCSYCCRACAGPDAIAFGEAWTKEAQIEASKTTPISHGICAKCVETHFSDEAIERTTSEFNRLVRE